ncbi:MAG: hemolysin family protein [Candidatus Promineifilaceae bacterium]|nr:hemolysin family protein [Candidatus Promineifilaceae bacterium]
MNVIVIIATVTLMVFFNALYVAAEFATVSSRRTKINQIAGQGNRLAQSLLPIIEDSRALDRYVAACQIGITISSLVLGAYGQNVLATALVEPIALLLDRFPSILGILGGGSTSTTLVLARSISVTVILFVITTIQVIMGELFPKSVAIQYPERVAMSVVWPLRISLKLFAPLIWLFNGSGAFILRLMGHKVVDKHTHIHSPEEIEILVSESHEGGLLDDIERQMLRNAFRMRDLTARQVMLHRTKLVAAPESDTVLEILILAMKEGFSRIPIYRETVDDIIGFVHVKDLFRLHVKGETNLKSVIREVVYVPETMPVNEVWQKLNTRRKYLAVVFDEFGGTAGLVTFEDLIEEIFGELQDEFDDEMALIARDEQGRIYLRGDLLVSDVNEYLELELPQEADTLSGLVFSLLGGVPAEGDEIKAGDTIIRVEAMEDLGVKEVSLQLSPTDSVSSITEWEVVDHE